MICNEHLIIHAFGFCHQGLKVLTRAGILGLGSSTNAILTFLEKSIPANFVKVLKLEDMGARALGMADPFALRPSLSITLM
jgi:hypothetical protein